MSLFVVASLRPQKRPQPSCDGLVVKFEPTGLREPHILGVVEATTDRAAIAKVLDTLAQTQPAGSEFTAWQTGGPVRIRHELAAPE